MDSDLNPYSVTLDWEGYFEQFREHHGRDCILFRGRLLFPDGWTYSASDYVGPEWSPEQSARDFGFLFPTGDADVVTLQIHYWTIRKERSEQDAKVLRNQLDSLSSVQQTRSVPLQCLFVNEEGKLTQDPIDWGALQGRLEWLDQDVIECEARLQEFKEFHTKLLQEVGDAKRLRSQRGRVGARRSTAS